MPTAPPIPDTMQSEPIVGLELGKSLLSLSDQERRTTLTKVRAGEITELEFDAVVFRAVYPNANFLRFRDADLYELASSFVGQPFLRNHDTADIGSRDGTIVGCRLAGDEILQTIRLTTQRGMEDYLQGRIDRFSIGWYYDDIVCSICDTRWIECSHWPGKRYKLDDAGEEKICELVFTNPRGKECSAVNVPAVRGTRVLADQEALVSDLVAALCEHKEHLQARLTPAPEQQPEPQPDPAPEPEPAPVTPEPTDSHLSAPEPEATTATGSETPILSHLSTPEIATMETEQTPTEALAAAPAAVPAQPAEVTPTAPAAPPVDPTPWLKAMQEATLTTMLQASRLSAEAQAAVRLAVGDVATASVERITQLIEAQRAVEARQAEASVVKGINPAYHPQFGPMLNDLDKFKAAFGALLDGVRPPDGIRPLTGIREAYLHLSGDYELTGKFFPERVQLSNVNTSTMAGLMVEFLNLRVVRSFQSYDQFWRLFCDVQNYTSLHDPHWLMLGGIGELSDVAEGATYTEKTWDTETETAKWVKKGNWLGITLEAFDKDQTGYLQQAPKALAQAAYLSLGKSFTRIFTTAATGGLGPVMRDSKPLFHADHANYGSTAFSLAAWEATRIAMARQTELGSGEVLGNLTVPRYIMIPRHLENKALVALASEGEPGTPNNDINPLAVSGANSDARRQAARRMIIVNDFLGTANNWYAMADPALYNLIGLGFRYGETPELFSVADPNSGLMFTNDVMPIKIRFFYSMGPIDYRGMYAHAVS